MFNFLIKVPSISTKDLQHKIQEGITLLDVRPLSDYHKGHIPTAKHMPLAEITHFKGNTATPIYLICFSGYNSKKATKILRKKGYNAINIRGGMSQWQGKIKGGK